MKFFFVFVVPWVGFSFALFSCQESPTEALSVGDIGLRITSCYHRTVGKAAELLRRETDQKALERGLEAIKHDAILELVELGRQREVLSADEDEQLDALVMKGLRAVDMDDWNVLDEATRKYQADAPEISELLFEINLITQYSDFELLRAQAPDEAKRLGIDKN